MADDGDSKVVEEPPKVEAAKWPEAPAGGATVPVAPSVKEAAAQQARKSQDGRDLAKYLRLRRKKGAAE